MATHFVCQSTEPLPHLYPTGLAQKSHGAVSQYEVYNHSNKAHTQFPPLGWDFSQSSEEDSLPLIHPAPQPEWRNTSLHPDPDLCVTPQKTATKSVGAKNGLNVHKMTEFEPDPLLTLTPEKSYFESEKNYDKSYYSNGEKGKKVRFDIEDSAEKYASLAENCDTSLTKKFSPNKLYQPELYGDCGVDKKDDVEKVHKGSSRTVQYTVGKVGNEAVYKEIPEESTDGEPTLVRSDRASAARAQDTRGASRDSQSLPVKVVREKPVSQTASDPIAMCRGLEAVTVPKRKVKVLRENQYMPKQTEFNYPFDQTSQGFTGGEEHMFARPEYNSTLRMKVEADKLKQCEIDVESALKKTLTISDSTKADINEKASSHVNNKGSTFSGLVSLDLPADQICQQAAELKTVRAKVSTATRQKQKDQKEPDLLEFFTSDRQRESVTYSLTGIPAPSEQLSMAPHSRAFDLYKHNRVWEGRGSNRK